MRRIISAFSAAALAFGLVAQAVPANAAVAGYDSAYAFQTDWMTMSAGQSDSWTVVFLNRGTTTWTLGTSTEVELAVCLEDKTTCNVSDTKEAPFNNGWVSTTVYAKQNQATVAPGQTGSFTVPVKVPAGQAADVYHFNADLQKADTNESIRNEGAFFDVKVVAAATAAGITVEPASDTNQTSTTASHTVTITFRDTAGNVQANVPIDVFIVNNATWNGTCSSTQLDSTASPNASGTSCTIDAGDFTTNASGQITFSFGNTTAGRVNKIVAWTGAVGSTYSSTAVQGTATKNWIGAVTQTDASPGSDINPFASSHTVTATLKDTNGDAVPLSGQTIRFTVYRNTTTFGTNTANSNTCTSGTVLSSNVAQTDAAGAATLTYTGPADPTSSAGDNRFDCVYVFYDKDNDGIDDGSAAGEFSESVLKQWTDAAAAATKLTLSPLLDGNPASTTHIVTATLKDQFGNPVSGALIRFTVSRTQATPVAQNMGIVISTSRTTGSDGTAQLGYVGPTFSANDVIDACYDVTTTTDACDGTGSIAFTSVDDAKKQWATEATAATYSTFTVRFCDTANDTVYAQNGTNEMFRFLYDADDQYTIATVPSTQAQFESACTPKTSTQASDTITITYTPGGVSHFNITANN